METTDISHGNSSFDIGMKTVDYQTHALSKTSSSGSIHTDRSVDSTKDGDGSHSNRSKEAVATHSSSSQLPTFTNEVVVIRPEVFYENEDCHQDNKFMKSSGLKRQSTNELVSS
jgi:hypothetical protein